MFILKPDSPRVFRVTSAIGAGGVLDEHPLECTSRSGKITVWYSAMRAIDGILAFVTCIPRDILPDGGFTSCDGRVYPIAADEPPVQVDSAIIRDIELVDDELTLRDHSGEVYKGKLEHVHNPRS